MPETSEQSLKNILGKHGEFRCLWRQGFEVDTLQELQHHIQLNHADKFRTSIKPIANYNLVHFHPHTTSIRGVFTTYHASLEGTNYSDIILFFEETWQDFSTFLLDQLQQRQFLKFLISRDTSLLKTTERKILEPVHFYSYCEVLSHESSVPSVLESCRNKLQQRLEEYSKEGSDFVLSKLNAVFVHVATFKPKSGGDFIRLPEKYFRRFATINIKKCSQQCFYFSILASLYKCDKRYRNTIGPYISHLHTLDIDKSEIPMPLGRVTAFAERNNLCVSVLGVNEEEDIFPLVASKEYQADEKRNVVLLYLQKGLKSHYVAVTDLGRLLGRTDGKQWFYCFRCLSKFSTLEARGVHNPVCGSGKIQRIIFNRKWIQFTDHIARARGAVFGDADFESILKPRTNARKDAGVSYTDRVNDHVCSGFAFAFFDEDLKLLAYKTYVGPNAGSRFLQELIIEGSKILRAMGKTRPMRKLTEAEKTRVSSTRLCDLCLADFTFTEKVLDHNHFEGEGKLRYVLCKKCNTALQLKPIISVYMHNFRRYDARFVLQGINSGMDVQFIGKSLLDLVGIQLEGFLRIVDSITLIPMSLDKAVQMLRAENRPNSFRPFDEVFRPVYGEATDMLLSKLDYPYEHFKSFEQYKETSLQSPDAFRSELDRSTLTADEYQDVREIWRKFGIKTLGQFTALYNLTDCFHLACLIHRFCEVVHSHVGLCPTHFFSLPSLAYSAILLHAKRNIEILTDIDQYLMISNGMSGGIATCGSARHVIADKPYVSETCKPDEMHTYIIMYDFTMFYGWCTTLPLGVGNFRWLSVSELEYVVKQFGSVDWEKHQFVMEVDLHYPKHLRKLRAHQNMPVVVFKEYVRYEMLSRYQKQVLEDSRSLKSQKPVQKLLCSFLDKKNIVLTGSVLKFYLEMGLELVQIHRGWMMDVARWGKAFIDLRANMRANAENDVVKMQAKLQVNSSYGKLCAREDRYVKMDLVRNLRWPPLVIPSSTALRF